MRQTPRGTPITSSGLGGRNGKCQDLSCCSKNQEIMTQKFGHRGETLLRSLISGFIKAKEKWQLRYEQATNEYLKLLALSWVNWYAEEIRAYKKILREGVKV